MHKFAINGAFLAQRRVGIQRFAYEIVGALDEICSSNELELLLPPNAQEVPLLRNIKVRRLGWGRAIFWEQVVLPIYAFFTRKVIISLCNVAPIVRPDIVCIHDVFYKTQSEVFRHSVYGVLARLSHCLQYWVCARFARHILTVSEYSRQQIAIHCGVAARRISVVGNGWEHIRRIQADPSIFRRFPRLQRENYYFTLGSVNEYKNVKWVLSAAVNSSNEIFVITGNVMRSAMPRGLTQNLDNVIFTGYLDDAEMKSLMENCKALIMPSKCEGFGIPPLEALALGRPIILSRCEAFLEVYGGVAHYIADAEDYDGVNPGCILQSEVKSPDLTLATWTWRNAAVRLYDALKVVL